MHVSSLKQSNFLTRAEVGKGILVTIRQIFQDNVAKTGAPEELKWCMSFDELEKPMVLNSTNGNIIAAIIKSEETDEWPGHKIVLYDDPTVSFAGKLVGGIRVRAPRGQAAAPAQIKPAPAHGRPANQPAPVTKRPEPAPYEPGSEPEPDDVPFN